MTVIKVLRESVHVTAALLHTCTALSVAISPSGTTLCCLLRDSVYIGAAALLAYTCATERGRLFFKISAASVTYAVIWFVCVPSRR